MADEQAAAVAAAGAKSHDVRRLESGREWSGYLTADNAGAVAARLRELLDGQRYAFVTVNEGMRDGFPEVRTGMRLRGAGVTAYAYADDRWWSVNVQDTYGSWGFHSDAADQAEARKRSSGAWDRATEDERRQGKWQDKNLARVSLKHGRIEIEHFAPAGFRLYWVAAVEWPEEDGRA